MDWGGRRHRVTKRFRNGLLSVFIVVSLLTSVGLPILGGTSFTSVSSQAQILTEDDNSASATFDDKTKLQGFDRAAGKWATGNLTGWKELDWVPYRLRFRDLPEGTSVYTLKVYHNNLLDGEDGVDKLRDFRVGDEDGNSVTGSVTVSGPFYKTSGKECDRDIYYALLVSFTTPSPGLTWCLYWRAHLAFGASKWPGSSLHAYTDINGKKSVPINVPPAPIGSISGYKWNDLNRDGTWGPDEPGLSGWTVQLYSFDPVENAWIYLADENTDDAGRYTFDELVAGGYRLCEVLKDNWTQTFPPSGCHEVALSEGETRDNINFGNLVVVLAPTVTTNAATGVATTQATMNANFTVGGYDSVDVWFQYRVQGEDTWTETTPTTYTTSGSHSDDATGLSSDTTYEFRAVLQYDTEKIYGATLTFTTSKVIPTVTTRAATGITINQATLNADFTIGNYDSVDVWFQYRVQGDLTWIETTSTIYTASGSHSDDATSLSPDTTYEFRAVLQYDSEKIYSDTLTFTTLKVVPTVTTRAATGITTTQATMNADFTVGDYDSVDVWFQYRAQGDLTWIETTPTTCTTSGSHSDDATSLSSDTTYEFRAVLQYDTEKIYSATLTFTTLKAIPTVTTNAATGITTTQATMSADFTVGDYDSVDIWFQYRVQGEDTWTDTTSANYTASGSHSDDATSLSPDTTYEFRAVLQYDSEKIYGATLTFTTLKVVPTVTTRAATGVATTQATMNADFTVGNYDSVDVWFQYRVQGEDAWIETTPETYTASGSHSDDATDLSPNTTYEFRACIQYDTEKIYGDPLTFTAKAVQPPSAPTPKSPADGTITNDNTPTFEWTHGENADNHRLLVDNDPDFSFPEENRIVLDNYYTIADENSLPDDNYSWKVIAIDAFGENESSIWTFLIDTIAPAAPTLGSPENNAVESDLTQTFTWTEPEAGVTYDIQIDNETSFTSPYVHENTGLADNSYIYTFASDCVYYWRVRAVDAANNQSPWADNFKLTIQAPPGQLTLYLPADGAITNDNIPTFEWTVDANADNHRLIIDDNPDFTSPIENRLFGSTDNTYTLENSLPDDNYSWKVIAINALGENQSPVWTFVIDTVPPGAPSLGSPADGTITDDNTPTFDWPDVEGAENYDLLLDDDPDFSSPEIQVTVPVSTYTPTAGLPDENYSWRVRARDAAGNVGDWSSTWTLIIKTVVRRAEASISPGSKSGAPGETLTYTITVKNTGSIADTYTLSAVGAQGWSVSIEPDSLTLAAGATGEAALSVVVPPDASENDSITVTVSAISVGNPSVTDSDTCGTVVKGAVVASGVNLAISLAILAFLIGAAILLLAYLLRGRRKRAARRRVLRSVWIGLGGTALAELYLTRGRRKRAARRRVLRGASPRPKRWTSMDRD